MRKSRRARERQARKAGILLIIGAVLLVLAFAGILVFRGHGSSTGNEPAVTFTDLQTAETNAGVSEVTATV